MTDKERLEDFDRLPFKKRIKLTKESIQKDLEASDYLLPKNVYINTKYILEIIEQAEQVQELEQLKIAFDELDSDYIDLQKQNKRYREALEEIARGRFPGASYKARKALEGDLE